MGPVSILARIRSAIYSALQIKQGSVLDHVFNEILNTSEDEAGLTEARRATEKAYKETALVRDKGIHAYSKNRYCFIVRASKS